MLLEAAVAETRTRCFRHDEGVFIVVDGVNGVFYLVFSEISNLMISFSALFDFDCSSRSCQQLPICSISSILLTELKLMQIFILFKKLLDSWVT